MFVQLIDIRLQPGAWEQFEALGRAAQEYWTPDLSRERGLVSEITVRDRKDPDHVIMVVQFESAEQAAANSRSADTNELYQRILALSADEPRFIDCELVSTMGEPGSA